MTDKRRFFCGMALLMVSGLWMMTVLLRMSVITMVPSPARNSKRRCKPSVHSCPWGGQEVGRSTPAHHGLLQT